MHSEKEGGREHDGPCDTGSATAGCYVSAPPALSPHRLSRLCFWPIPHPVAAAHFFSLSTHMAPHMAPSLPPSRLRSLSHHPFLSLPSTHLQPRGATNLCCLCCHSLCLFRLSAFPSHYFHQSLLSISPSMRCAVRLQLHAPGYHDMTDSGHKYTLKHTQTHLHQHFSRPCHCLASQITSAAFQKASVLQI